MRPQTKYNKFYVILKYLKNNMKAFYIYNGTFYENNYCLFRVNYFRKKLSP